MLYPVYVHKDTNSAYGMTFPDFPGCFSAADELADIPRLAQEAIEVHFFDELINIPPPSTLDKLQHSLNYQGGFWLLLDVDLDAIQNHKMRLNIYLPIALVERIDLYVARQNINRDVFLSIAAERIMAS